MFDRPLRWREIIPHSVQANVRRFFAAVATSREGYRSPRSGRAIRHRRWGRERWSTGIDANGKVSEGFRAQGVQGADAFASPGAEIDWSCEDQTDWSKRVDVAVGGGSGVSHKLYEKTPRKGLAENPRQRAILDAQFPVLRID
jgi:hypothetical protein